MFRFARLSLLRSASSRSLVVPPSSSPTWVSSAPGWSFSVGVENGWMPRHMPLRSLPARFHDVETLLTEMPINRLDGSKGLLAKGLFGDAVKSRLALHDISDVSDGALLSALYRDYSFLASAYLLEPSHLGMSKDGKYAQGRDHLPASIAIPLEEVSKKLQSFPFLDYAHGYALNNWFKSDPNQGMEYQNLRLIRSFEGGKDEEGFIVIHIAMVNKTNAQIAAQTRAILAASQHNHHLLAAALNDHAAFLKDIVGIFGEMWKASRPTGYLGFRTFIMGITGNDDIFPNGVVYEGVDRKPQYYRGETGAQDSIVPSTDTLLGMPYPVNNLTSYLMDLRAYRPKDHRAYLQWLKDSTVAFNVKQQLLAHPHTAVALLRNLEMIRAMRASHWTMTNKYIIAHTKHAKATGGTPITTWLPNQLGSTMEYMAETAIAIKKMMASGVTLFENDQVDFFAITSDLGNKIEMLKKEVAQLQPEFEKQEVTEFQRRAKV